MIFEFGKGIREAQRAHLMKSYTNWSEDSIEKGGEGSRGGKIIGHTKSGKPIYESANHESHKDFTSDEHREADKMHYNYTSDRSKLKGQKIFGKEKSRERSDDYHYEQASLHEKKAEEIEKEDNKVEKSDVLKAFEILGLGDLIEKGGIGSGKHKTINWLNDTKNDKEEIKDIKDNIELYDDNYHVYRRRYLQTQSDEDRYKMNKWLNLRKEQEKLLKDKEGVDVKKSEDTELQKAYKTLGINL